MSHFYRLVVSCPDRLGIVARVSNFIAGHGGSITEANQHSDLASGRFFMRYEILADSIGMSKEALCEAFAPVAREFEMDWALRDTRQKRRVVLMVSRESHCLVDLLYRWTAGELDCEIAAVISNHDDMRKMVEWHGIPYHHVPVSADDKSAAFAEVERLVEASEADSIVLARYMQILPPDLCERYSGRVINIHHSFLPSFAGAKPYHQAYQRGVKLIGATCHYVTEELDAGPIIEQDIHRVSHCHTPDDLVRFGRDVEKTVLARGLRWHLEDRVLIHDNKTVVFA
ncbi:MULTISPECIES: formyltetrahydrofolate deformylase [unclassified Halomonas]|uniref:Formyltetrahydrofolate deformylase n=2 Tax=unclassified Halomonas TaxID=2609666 RepID=A0AAU7KCX7_9GAMM|nr:MULTISPECIES: formyltetrahydrofolate deformylase [unclassified Halomonas]MBR9772584.1 formyltetrahydrofolate deformylase [Gammaproteobacteria bacterium]MBS8267220.1 formyltetrahydrofolate deformylase [Halomonas litopenaei]KJZ07626.1 formyltetrahydrofolate deformylase [Halomonas sp. S2151]MBR9881610.1 formyltetrahydrofolate deformylase [Gammaproteobacteria bacterium]MBY5941112.1 formyltetrahydrofolate deformylase [Halomonas sp. DP5N14-9]|tara:strand:+ start:1370 stop:2224 length:855 start_codon:yes stop_codon:yes gene_type:complete